MFKPRDAAEESQQEFWIETKRLPKATGNPFYRKLARTHHPNAPWTIVHTDDKKTARLWKSKCGSCHGESGKGDIEQDRSHCSTFGTGAPGCQPNSKGST